MKKSVFIPLRDMVVFPNIILPLFIGRPFSIKALQNIIKSENKTFVVSMQKNSDEDDIELKDLEKTGVEVSLLQFVKLPDGSFKVLIEGQRRVNLKKITKGKKGFYTCEYTGRRTIKNSDKIDGIKHYTKNLFIDYSKFEKKIPEELVKAIMQNDEKEKLCDLISAHIIIKPADKQSILEESDLYKRYEKAAVLLESEISLLKMENKIEKDVKKRINKQQKEYFLREQMKVIQEELGVSDKSDVDKIKERLKEEKYPEKVFNKINEEIVKLERIGNHSPDYHVKLNYIEWLLNLPWEKYTEDEQDINKCEKILNSTHYGLKEVKERIVEFIAVKRLSKEPRTPILCLTGPPGVGKTSLGKAVAKSLGRKFVQFSLGGVKDEAEIRGHRQTYIGAMPGRIINMIKESGSANPVIMLDEIDKIASSFRGDPASALLEILDPDHNKNFSDNFINIPFDLSKAMFITTANYMYNIPSPLLDRMEVINITGYTVTDKIKLAEKFLIPKLIKEHGLNKNNMNLNKDSLKNVIQNYTMEAGVRNLSNKLSKLLRKIALKILREDNKDIKVKIDSNFIEEVLGPPVFKESKKCRKSEKGIAQGLAWTQFGGDILTIEVTLTPGDGRLVLTGQLGDVMKESARTALTYIKSKSRKLKIKQDIFKKNDIHVHVPEGAVPKDGPSAGITLVSAILSAILNKKYNTDYAMTGEVTLRGKVLPIGGLKEKSMAAYLHGVKKIFIPEDNKKDIREIAEEVKKNVDFIPVSDVSDVIKEVLI